MAQILLIEDDLAIATLVADLLLQEGHGVSSVSSAEEAQNLLTDNKYGLIISDWNLSGKLSGLDLISMFRSQGGMAPVLMLSAKTEFTDRELGLDNGADDYLCKPFHSRELLARVKALLRRAPTIVNFTQRAKNVELDSKFFKVFVDGAEIKLFPKEFALLEFFLRYPNQTFSNDSIIDSVWSSDSAATVETLRQVMARLRAKLEESGAKDLIKTVHGIGYKLEDSD